MNTSANDGNRLPREDRAPYGPGEDTLHLIAGLPAPEGLADRVRERLHAAPQPARILIWRGPLRPPGGWLHSALVRGFAAAAIVCVVAGGGWRICSRVEPGVKVEMTPVPVSPVPKGFALTGEKHVPETLQGPVLNHSVQQPPAAVVAEPPTGKPALSAPAQKKKSRRSAAPPVE
jgi:hypothetical protein